MSSWQLAATVVMGAFTVYQGALLVRFLATAEARSLQAEQQAQQRLARLRQAYWRSRPDSQQRTA